MKGILNFIILMSSKHFHAESNFINGRHSLFTDHVKRTRSTIWLKKDDLMFHPVTKLK